MPVYESFPAFKDFPYGRGDHAQRSRDVVELAKWLKWISYYDYQSSEHPDWPQHFAIIGDIVGAKQAVMVAPSGGSADRTLPDRVPSNPRAFASLPALRALRPFPSPPVPAAAIFSGTHLGVP